VIIFGLPVGASCGPTWPSDLQPTNGTVADGFMGIAGFFACANAADVAPRAKARSRAVGEEVEW